MTGRLKKKRSYLINFMDTRSAQYTWYSGPGIFLKKHYDDFGENEPHYEFLLPDGNECVFPRSSVVGELT